MNVRWLQRSLVTVAGGCLMTGCALSNAHVKLAYNADPATRSPLSELKPMTIALQMEDQREASERDRVGDRINGFGQVTAKVLADQDATVVVQNALQAELEKAGHKIVAADGTEGTNVEATLTVVLKKYWCESKMHFWDVEMVGTINTEVNVVNPADPSAPFKKPISSTYRESRQVVVDGAFQSVLNRALAEFIHDFSLDPAIVRALRESHRE
jgi:uncharacterized lipoprotein YajG